MGYNNYSVTRISDNKHIEMNFREDNIELIYSPWRVKNNRYNCNNVLDFYHEANRMCEDISISINYDCISKSCPFHRTTEYPFGDESSEICKLSDPITYPITQEQIDAVQQYSDTHPEKEEEETPEDVKLTEKAKNDIYNLAIDDAIKEIEESHGVFMDNQFEKIDILGMLDGLKKD